MQCSCKGCGERYPGCHSYCDKYKEWAKETHLQKEKIKEAKKYDWSDNYYLPSRSGKRKFEH